MDLSARIDLNQRKKRVIPCYIIRDEADESDLSDGADADNKLGKREKKNKKKKEKERKRKGKKRKGKKRKGKKKKKATQYLSSFLLMVGYLFFILTSTIREDCNIREHKLLLHRS